MLINSIHQQINILSLQDAIKNPAIINRHMHFDNWRPIDFQMKNDKGERQFYRSYASTVEPATVILQKQDQ